MTVKEARSLWDNCNSLKNYQHILLLMNKQGLLAVTEKDFDRMLYWDEQQDLILANEQLNWHAIERPKIREALKEMKLEADRDFVKDSRLEYLDNELDRVNDYLERCYLSYDINDKRGIEYETRSLLYSLWDSEEYEKKQQKLLRLIHQYERDDIDTNTITDEMTATAREYPIDTLLEFNTSGFAICPYHSESTPSFSHWKKANLGHCFGCHKTVDSIQLVRDSQKKTFSEAIYFLTK